MGKMRAALSRHPVLQDVQSIRQYLAKKQVVLNRILLGNTVLAKQNMLPTPRRNVSVITEGFNFFHQA